MEKMEEKEGVEKVGKIDSAVVLCLIGLPASGKTYLATEIQKEPTFSKFFTQIDIIDPDAIRFNTFGENFQPENEALVIEEKYNKIVLTIKPGHLVIVDDLHYLTSMRHSVLEISKHHDAQYISIYVNSSVDQCLKWNKLRGSPIPDSVIQKIAQKFDAPGKKYAWDNPSLIYFPPKMEISQILSKLYRIFEQLKVSSAPRASLASSASSVSSTSSVSQVLSSGVGSFKNSIDLQSRRLIGQILSQSIPESDLKRLLTILNISQNGVNYPAEFGLRLNSLRKKFVSWLLVDRKGTEVTLNNFFEFLDASL